MLAAIAPALIFVAFLLLLLISLSAPIIHSIFIFRLSASVSSSLLATSASTHVDFGVFGYCISALNVHVEAFQRSAGGTCSPKSLGYTFDSTVANALGANNIRNLVRKATTAVLVLHPIAAALTFLAFLISLFILRRGSNNTSRLPSFLTLAVGLLATFLTTIIFLIDVIVVAVIRHRVHNATHGDLTLTWGNAVWMALGATIALWLAMVGACAGVCACGSQRTKRNQTY